MTEPLVAVLVSGMLGAGKTTLINGMLEREPGRRIAVIENEAGDACVDADLLQGAASVIEVVGGCACCTLRGALLDALAIIAERSESLDGVIVESSGVADPVPIVQAFQAAGVRSRFRLTGVVCVVDAEVAAGPEALSPLWQRQLRHADVAVLSKCGRISEGERVLSRQVAGNHFHGTRLIEAERGMVDLGDLLSADAPARPRLEAKPVRAPAIPQAATLHVRAPVHLYTVSNWLRGVHADLGADLLRLKGSAPLPGGSGHLVVNATPAQFETWKASGLEEREGRLVLLGYGIESDRLQAELDLLADLAEELAAGRGA